MTRPQLPLWLALGASAALARESQLSPSPNPPRPAASWASASAAAPELRVASPIFSAKEVRAALRRVATLAPSTPDSSLATGILIGATGALASASPSAIAPERNAVAAEQNDVAPEQNGVAAERNAVAAEQNGVAPEQNAAAAIQSAVAVVPNDAEATRNAVAAAQNANASPETTPKATPTPLPAQPVTATAPVAATPNPAAPTTAAPDVAATATPAPGATPTPAPDAAALAPLPSSGSPVTAPNTQVPDAPPAPGLPSDPVAAVSQEGAASPQNASPGAAGFGGNPNLVFPSAPLPVIGGAPAPQIASDTPLGPPLPPIVAPLPAPGEGDVQSGTEPPGGNFSLETPAGEGLIYDMERGFVLARRGATLRYREFTVQGDRGLIDYNTNRATLAGNLTVTVRGQVFRGQSLTFDLDAGRWTLSSLATQFPPEFFPPGAVLEPLYVRNGTVTGDFDTLSGQNFRFSSCDRDHYYIQSKRIEFFRAPGGEPSRIVLRRNAVYVLGRRLLPLPVYVIALAGATTRRQPLQATFGQNTLDGYFVRSLYDLRATPKVTDSLLIDTLQKRGLGLGFQRLYAATGGILYFYALSGKSGGREVNSRVDRTYNLTQRIATNLQFNSTQNNSLSGEGFASQTGQFTLTRDGDRAQSSAILSFDRSQFGGGESEAGSVALSHRQNFGSGYALEATALLNRAQSGDSSDDATRSDSATNDNLLTLSKSASAFDLFLRAETHSDLVNNVSYQTERLPELTLQSTTQRLPLPGLSRVLPGNFSMSLGRYNEPSSGADGSRADFFYTPQNKNYRLLGRGTSQSQLSAAGNFEQAFYSDDIARYNYAYNFASTSTLGPAQVQMNYSKQRTYGFTPFQFDFSTPGEYLDYTFSVRPSARFRFNLSGGRDIQNDYTRDLIASAQFAPNQKFYASLGTSYRLQESAVTTSTRFGDIYANLRVARNRNRFGGGQLALGLRYSPATQDLTRANGSLDVNLGRRTRVQALVGYDGYGKTFDFTQFRVTRDLHCFNLYATYDGQLKQLRFDLAIKAFPFADTRFGRNQFSEGFDPSVGGLQ